MALTYRNTLKGHVVAVPEPADILTAAEAEAEKLARLGTKRARLDAELLMDKAQSRALHQRQTLAKMDESRRWERYTPPAVVVPAEPAPPAPEPAPQLAPKPTKAPAKAAKPDEPPTEA